MSTERIVKLSGNTYAEESSDARFFIRKDDELISPFGYAWIWVLTPQSYCMRRYASGYVDILFASGSMFFGAFYAHDLGSIGRGYNRNIIAALVERGTHILDDQGNYLTFIPGYPRIALFDGEFLVVFKDVGPEPHVVVYDIFGKQLGEGPLWKAIHEAQENV